MKALKLIIRMLELYEEIDGLREELFELLQKITENSVIPIEEPEKLMTLKTMLSERETLFEKISSREKQVDKLKEELKEELEKLPSLTRQAFLRATFSYKDKYLYSPSDGCFSKKKEDEDEVSG